MIIATQSAKPMRRASAGLCVLSSLSLAALLSGCATSISDNVSGSAPVSAVSVVQGKVMGGQQPVSGATIQLWAVGTTGAKSASTSLLTTTVITDTTGGFSITGKYPCPTGSFVYLTATGGNPGLSGTVSNGSLALMVALGNCSTLLATYPYIQVNELTTVASVYALAAFMSDYQHVGAPADNTTGIQNAFATVTNLVSIANGNSPGTALPATSTVPTAELNTLANILSYCVNTNGTDGKCASLFTATNLPSSSNTISAALSIATNPVNPNIFTFASANPPFQPALTGAPADWTVAIKATGGGISSPAAIAIDANGFAWIANASGTSITSLNATQGLRSGTGGYTTGSPLGPQGIAIDTNNDVWIANSYGGNVLELDNNGNLLSPTGGYTLGGITSPSAIAVDLHNNVWVTNYNSSTVSGLSNTGGTIAAISGSPFTGSGAISQPTGVTIDGGANVWVSSPGANAVVKLSSTGASLSGSTGDSDGVLQAPYGLAVDSLSHLYVAGNGINEVSVFNTSTGAASASAPVSGTGLISPAGVSVDGSNIAFVTNSQTAGSISMIASPTATPVILGSLNMPIGIAVDASGNVWTANAGDNSVSEFIGLATPIRTPLALRYTVF